MWALLAANYSISYLSITTRARIFEIDKVKIKYSIRNLVHPELCTDNLHSQLCIPIMIQNNGFIPNFEALRRNFLQALSIDLSTLINPVRSPSKKWSLRSSDPPVKSWLVTVVSRLSSYFLSTAEVRLNIFVLASALASQDNAA